MSGCSRPGIYPPKNEFSKFTATFLQLQTRYGCHSEISPEGTLIMAGMTAAKRFIIRISLITGSTLATIIGAQSLAALDSGQFSSDSTSSNPPSLPPTSIQTQPTEENTEKTDIMPRQAAPNIVILRRPGQTSSIGGNSSESGSSTAITGVTVQPPSPVQVAPPPAVVVQQVGSGGVSAPSTRPSR